MKPEKVRFYTERTSFGIQAMVILMALSVVFRIIGCWGLWNDRSYAITQIALPIASALLYIASVWLLGKRALWLSFLPVVMGAVFFIIRALEFESSLRMIVCLLLYIAVIVLYFCTIFGIIRTKWILVSLLGLPFLYHVFVEDLAAMRDTTNPVSFGTGMQEMGVLCIMLGLFAVSISMKKAVAEHKPHLPKIRKPHVIGEQTENENTDEIPSVTEENENEMSAANPEEQGEKPADPEQQDIPTESKTDGAT